MGYYADTEKGATRTGIMSVLFIIEEVGDCVVKCDFGLKAAHGQIGPRRCGAPGHLSEPS